jgi:3-dehydroquinate synthase
MTKKAIKIDFGREASSYKILIGDRLEHVGRWAQTCLKRGGGKIVIVSNHTVFSLYGDACERSLHKAGFSVTTFLMKDGEKHKSLKTAESALIHFAKLGLTRSDAVIALGGGVVGDLAGFAASVYLRGIAYLQIPTTLLSMIDSSVGGKTGVNTAFGKNLVGAFHQPNGVFIDTSTLSTLPKREMTAGFCEMVKHGALSGRKLLSETHSFLKADQNADISDLIAKNIAFKAQIVAGDERESLSKTDSKSRKILNFGHTLAHALEKATNYSYFKHGEAVGYGILYAAELSKYLDLLAEKDVKLLNDVVQCVGPLPSLTNVDENKVLDAFVFDKKNIAGSLQMVLLKGFGKPVLIMERIPRPLMQKTLKKLFKRWA